MIDNFDQIIKLLSFNNKDEFYFVQVLKRKKENPELGNNSYVVKTYYIKSVEDLMFNKGEMIVLANYHNARICINLNKRSFERTCLHTLKKITDQIIAKDYSQARKAYNSVCGTFMYDIDKTWVVDIDVKDDSYKEVIEFINTIQPEGDKLVSVVNTKAGVHLITKPFNMELFSCKYPEVDVHKNNSTLLYIS